MRHQTASILIPLLALPLAAAGCVMPYNGPNSVRKEVQEATGRDYDKTFALTVGRSGLALIRWAVEESEEEELPQLRGLRKVEIGFYEARREAAGGPGVSAAWWPEWSPLVEMHPGDGENVLILSEAGDRGEIRRLLFVVEDGDELTIVRLKGDLGLLIEDAIRYAFQQAHRPDLAGPSLEEYLDGRT